MYVNSKARRRFLLISAARQYVSKTCNENRSKTVFWTPKSQTALLYTINLNMNTSSFSSNLHSFWNVSINWRGALNILNTWNEKRSVFSQTLSSLKNILNLNIQSDSIVRQTNKVHVLSYTTMNSNHIFLLQFFQVHQLKPFFYISIPWYSFSFLVSSAHFVFLCFCKLSHVFG